MCEVFLHGHGELPPYYRALPNRHVGKVVRLGWQKKEKKKRVGRVGKK